jgi:hypothetical protein
MNFLQNDSSVGAFDITRTWSLAEETMLLDAVEQYGFGNWLVFFSLSIQIRKCFGSSDPCNWKGENAADQLWI